MGKKSWDCLLFPRFYANFASNKDFDRMDILFHCQNLKKITNNK